MVRNDNKNYFTHTPFYVWLLLGYLIWGGWKATKSRIISWKTLLIMPAIMFTWSIYSIFLHHGPISICLWEASIILGMYLGFLTVHKLDLIFDKKRNLIQISGSSIPIILSILVFFLRYFLGATYGLHPELQGSITLLVVESIATIVSGMFIGRLVGYWKRSKISSHTDLSL